MAGSVSRRLPHVASAASLPTDRKLMNNLDVMVVTMAQSKLKAVVIKEKRKG